MADTTVGFGFAYPAVEPGDAATENCPAAGRVPNDPAQDIALLAGLRDGEELAYETLVLRFEHVVYGIVSRIVDDPGDSCDVVQEVFLKVFRKVGSFRGDSSLKTWIYRIAINEARNHRRWFGRHRAKEIGLEVGLGADSHWDHEEPSRGEWLEDSGQSPYEATLDHEVEAIMEQALSRLSQNHRAALILREVDGLSYEEIAGILDVPQGTVKSRILRARDALRKELLELSEPQASGSRSEGVASQGFALEVRGRHTV